MFLLESIQDGLWFLSQMRIEGLYRHHYLSESYGVLFEHAASVLGFCRLTLLHHHVPSMHVNVRQLAM